MTAADFDLSEWDFLPPLDEASLPDEPPVELVLVEWSESTAPALIFADPADSETNAADAVRQGLAWRRPGAAEMTRLASLDYQTLNAAERINALADQHRQAAWWSARQATPC